MSTRGPREKAVFCQALEIADPEQRRQFLDQACGADPALREQVEKLLALSPSSGDFFKECAPALEAAEGDADQVLSAAESALEPEIPETKCIGPYKLLQRLGEGGCGVVYMAEQDQPIRRRVALKIIKLGMDTKSVTARFEAERQALALMDHPNIARVLDAGATATGRPYFVMELVYGVKITEYCDQNRVNMQERLELFIQVCNAVQHAHQKGIIHRDLKPSNIMVTMHDGVPVTKVIDFGIAKATEQRLTDKTLFTSYAQLMGTPAYMSPEQMELSGLNLDTRSDIYSLGVLLYDLLTGHTPFDTTGLLKLGVDELRRTVREQEPLSPSAKLQTLNNEELSKTAMRRYVEPPRLLSQLRGDLDWIVLKCLEKDRTRRYATATGLAEDIERYLHEEAVLARPPSRLYRLQKLVRRNRLVFAAGTAVALALIAGLGASTWMFFKAEEARANEAALRRQAEAREKLTEAVMLANQGNYEGAARLLEAMKNPSTRPSLDGVSVLRSVGEWLALQGRWREAANRFSALMKIDKLDSWGPVTLDHQSFGVVLIEGGDLDGFERFREAAVARFLNETNGDAAGRILKTCLLPPVHDSTPAQLRPLGQLVEEWTEAQSPATRAGWAAIPIALWEYRTGEFEKAKEHCRFGLDSNDSSPRTPTIRLILAMACYRTGLETEAREHLAQARELVEAKFQLGLDRGASGIGKWYDWVFARVLLREAEVLIPEAPLPTSSAAPR